MNRRSPRWGATVEVPVRTRAGLGAQPAQPPRGEVRLARKRDRPLGGRQVGDESAYRAEGSVDEKGVEGGGALGEPGGGDGAHRLVSSWSPVATLYRSWLPVGTPTQLKDTSVMTISSEWFDRHRGDGGHVTGDGEEDGHGRGRATARRRPSRRHRGRPWRTEGAVVNPQGMGRTAAGPPQPSDRGGSARGVASARPGPGAVGLVRAAGHAEVTCRTGRRAGAAARVCGLLVVAGRWPVRAVRPPSRRPARRRCPARAERRFAEPAAGVRRASAVAPRSPGRWSPRRRVRAGRAAAGRGR